MPINVLLNDFKEKEDYIFLAVSGFRHAKYIIIVANESNEAARHVLSNSSLWLSNISFQICVYFSLLRVNDSHLKIESTF